MSVLESVKQWSRRLWGGWGIFWMTCVGLLLVATVGQRAAKERRKAASLRALEAQTKLREQVAANQVEAKQYAIEAEKAAEAASASEARAAQLDTQVEAAKARVAAIRARLKEGK